MQIVIDIPKEFEAHFNSDKFEDSLHRIRFDIHKAFIGNKAILSGNYEIETLDMLTEAFLNGTQLPKGPGDLIDRSEVIKSLFDYHNGKKTIGQCIDDVPTIIEVDKESELNERK